MEISVDYEGINDKAFRKRLDKSIKETGYPPDKIEMFIQFDWESYKAFLKRFESFRYKRKATNTFISKNDVYSQLLFMWGKAMDKRYSDELFEEPVFRKVIKRGPRKNKRPKGYESSTGRKKKNQTTIFGEIEATKPIDLNKEENA